MNAMYWLTSIQPHPFAVLPYILKEVAQTVERKGALGATEMPDVFRFHIRGPLLQMFSGKLFTKTQKTKERAGKT